MRIKLNVFFILFLFAGYFAGWLHQLLTLFACVFLHEIGHVLTAKKLRIAVYEVELLPYGGVARMEELSKLGGMSEALVSAAGPLTSIVLALFCCFLRDFSGLFESALKYNLALCIFNLMPVIPLDGGKIARNIMVFYMGYIQATQILIAAGRAAALFLLALNICTFLSGGRSAALLIAAVFIHIGTVREKKNCSYYYLLTGNSGKSAGITTGRIKKRQISVREDASIRSVVNHFSPVTYCYVNVLDDSGNIRAVIDENEIMEGLLQFGYDGDIEQILNSRTNFM